MTLTDRLAGVGEILIAISGSPLPTHVFQSLADHAPSVIACDYLAVCLPDAEGGGGYLVHPLVEPGPAAGAPQSCVAGEGIPGRAMESSRPIVVDDLSAGIEGAGPLEAGWLAAGLRSLVAAPLRRTGDLAGALVLGARAVRAYDSDDVRIATLLAGGIAATLSASRAYQALADERSTLGAVVGSMQDAVLMVSVDGLVLMANPAVHVMVGLHPDTLAGQPLTDVMPEGPLRALLTSGAPGVAELPLPGGRTAHASVVPVTTPYGEAVGVAAILRDVTHFKELEQMKNTFVHTVSHDLKNPIAGIVLTAEMMQRAGAANPRYGEHCEMILRAARGMSELVGDLLDLGRIESGMDAARELVDVVALVRDVAAALAPQAEAKRIALSVNVPRHATVSASPGRIRQVLANLAGNAVKYTPEGGRVEMALTAEGEHVRVTVTDSGIGIPASALPYVFDKFYRVKSAATREIEGTGLGLAITKSIIEAHGGRIWVESQEGRGSTFGFDLSAAP